MQAAHQDVVKRPEKESNGTDRRRKGPYRWRGKGPRNGIKVPSVLNLEHSDQTHFIKDSFGSMTAIVVRPLGSVSPRHFTSLGPQNGRKFFQMKCAVPVIAQTKDYYVENNFQH